MKMMVDLAHDFLRDYLHEDAIAVDFTMGNGFDTLFLCNHAKFVYAFDVQQEAYDHTKERLEKANLSNYSLLLTGHEHAKDYIPKYNCGQWSQLMRTIS